MVVQQSFRTRPLAAACFCASIGVQGQNSAEADPSRTWRQRQIVTLARLGRHNLIMNRVDLKTTISLEQKTATL
jgi:hypothetical protein